MTKMNRIATAERSSWSARLVVLTLFALFGIAFALQARAQVPAGDPPDRVARLSDESGQVWLYSQDDNEWVELDRNRPLTTGDRIATDNDARAEITLGTTTLRLDAATELEIVQLDDSTYRVHLHGGSVAARLRSPQSLAEFALETDEGQFRVQAVGRYRFDRYDQASDLTVDAGRAAFEGSNSALPLTAGQHAQFWLDASGAPQYNMIEPARDTFARWNDERDRAESRPVAAVRYVSPEMTGGDDLDRYGQWEQSPDYGPLWTPANVAVDWAPYSAGRWAWVRPWGWTWVDAAPWGFAPFHYGRWVNYRSRWSWAPGTYVARPVYAPALVAWIGGPRVGASLSIGAGGPPVGWFPLAPHEVYVPSYRTSPRYVREINITHVTNVSSITTIINNVNGAGDRREFANRKFPNAVTVVPAGVLTARQPVGPAAAQFRGNPQVRALVADARPGPAMIAAPVATPAARPRLPQNQGSIVRPPFQGRAPGLPTARPGDSEGRPTLDARRPDARPGERPNPGAGTRSPGHAGTDDW
nr:FecR domain-containing protein [Pseudomonadota bacterium]